MTTGEPPATAPAPQQASNLVVRLLTAAVMVPVILYLLFWAPPWGFQVLVGLAVVIAAYELFSMTMAGSRFLRGLGIALSCVTTAAFAFAPTAEALAGVLVAVPIVGMLSGLVRPEPIASADRRMAWMIAGPLYVGLLGTIARLHLRDHGGAWVLLTMFLSWLADTGGYFAGRAFGKRKLYEKVSPKKTVEGAIGGLLGATAGAVFTSLVLLPELPVAHAVALGLVGGALGQMGDLTESLVKRATGVKDSGSIVPGHGGILDRIDALFFTSAITWLYATYLLDGGLFDAAAAGTH
jgi:phosphatidate cytidylyltransferase